MRTNQKLTEGILDRPFTVKSFTYQDNTAIISVEGLKDIFIDVDEDFRIDAAGASLGQRQKDYLGRYYYDISKKLMELSGMSSDQIEARLKKLETERTMDTEDFLRKFKPNYKGLIYDFSKYVEIYHISARWSDYAVYTEKVLKESWEEFYKGGNWDGQRFCHFRPEKYLGIIGKRDVVDLNEWIKFADSNIGYGLGRGSGPTYYSLKSLDEAFEEFESSLGKVEESIESKLAENFANELKNLQKEGLFENVKSFDLDFTGRGINIKLNEMAYKDDYEEYNEKGKEYDKRISKTIRQKDALRNKMYRLKPVSFTFDGDTFTLKNTKVTETYDNYLIYKIDVTNSSGLLHTFGIRSYEANIDNADKFSSVESALDEVNLGWHIEQIYDHADIKYKDKEAFTETFGEAVIDFIQPMLLRKSKTTKYDDKYSSISLSRYTKDKDILDSTLATRDKAEASWRKEHFGVEGYEVGQIVEVYDGRSGGARSLGKIIKITPSGTATIQLEDGTTIVRRHVEDDENIILFRPRKNNNYFYDARDIDLVDPSTSTEDTIAAHKKAIGLK